MTDCQDPFAYHPELRGSITDPLGSVMRDLTFEKMVEDFPEMERFREWVHTNEDREAMRTRTLAGRRGGDLWVFAYGSLMWDPAIRFAEVRRADIEGYARRFILLDDGARGTEDAPGLMAALDHGPGCAGLAYRIRSQDIDVETEILWRREMIGPGYQARFLPVRLDGTTVEALAFVADHGADVIHPDLSRSEQIHHIAHGSGVLGTSRDYLAGIVRQLDLLNIPDPDCVRMLREVDTLINANSREHKTTDA